MLWKAPKHYKYLLFEDKTNWVLGILRVCTFHKSMITIDHKEDHIKKNLIYFQTKINVTKVGTEKEDRVWFPYFSRFLLDFLWQMFWVGNHTLLKYTHPEDIKKLYCFVHLEAKKTYALVKWAHLLDCQLPNAAMMILELKIFLITWNILLLNLFSVSLLCWLRTGRWYIKFLVETKMQRASLLYVLGSESFCVILWNFFNPFQVNASFLYPQKTLEYYRFSMFSSGTTEVADWFKWVNISNTCLYKVQRTFLHRNQSLNWKTHLINFKSMFYTYTLKRSKILYFLEL